MDDQAVVELRPIGVLTGAPSRLVLPGWGIPSRNPVCTRLGVLRDSVSEGAVLFGHVDEIHDQDYQCGDLRTKEN